MPSQVIIRDLGSRPRRYGNKEHGYGEPETELTCFLIHHSGGSAAGYAPLAEHLPLTWRVLAVELPGRGASVGESACVDMAALMARVAPAVLDNAGDRYAVFGHSLGALVGYELVREAERRGTPPVWLGVSGSPAPHRIRDRLLERRDLWPRERLVAFLRELGGTPEEMLEIPDVVDYMVNVLRADLRIVDTYQHIDGPALSTPVSVFSGNADPLAAHELLGGWRERTLAPVSFHTWPGGHFYLFDHPESFCKSLVADVNSALSGTPTAAREEMEDAESHG
ncbi:thioesterase II family protein [Streptomyces milbemycinicus]|uniref:thioesterase II family protein n=1 Tax=Streptomyces milbemycinicus TaxID=476552 RepID=UPI0033FA017D